MRGGIWGQIQNSSISERFCTLFGSKPDSFRLAGLAQMAVPSILIQRNNHLPLFPAAFDRCRSAPNRVTEELKIVKNRQNRSLSVKKVLTNRYT